MATITREYIEQMGQTGEGISQEDEIDMSLKNEFTNKWGQ